MIKRTHLRQFLAVVDTGGFTRGADRVGVTQPSLSAGIAELERLVGAKLFLRDRRRIRLTEAGNRFLSHARAAEREFRLAEASAQGSVPLKVPIQLGILSSLSTIMIAHIAAIYDGEDQLVLIEGNDANLRKRLAEGRLDAALTLLRPEERERAALAQYEEGYSVMLTDQHPLAKRDMLEVADVAGETMIARRSCEILAETSQFFTQRGVRPPFFMRSTNDDRCLEMVRIGCGVTTAPQSLVREGINAIPLAGYDFRRTVGLLRPINGGSEAGHDPIYRACATILREWRNDRSRESKGHA